MRRELHIVTYHYIRDVGGTPDRDLKTLAVDEFRRQVEELSASHEMAPLSAAIEFIAGRYEPARDLCLLTFDDGLREHFEIVAPLLADRGIAGLFFPVTSCLEGEVAAVHKNHFLMARLGLASYREAFLDELQRIRPGYELPELSADVIASTYRWDTPETAVFKYLYNFALPWQLRDAVVVALFQRHVAPERDFASQLYASWEDLRAMQSMGMIIGGHTHSHRALAQLQPEELEQDLHTCRQLLDRNLESQPIWPFSYPFGKPDSFTPEAVAWLKKLNFQCAVTTEDGTTRPGRDLYHLRRQDCRVFVSERRLANATS